jgi:hypothetical protein
LDLLCFSTFSLYPRNFFLFSLPQLWSLRLTLKRYLHHRSGCVLHSHLPLRPSHHPVNSRNHVTRSRRWNRILLETKVGSVIRLRGELLSLLLGSVVMHRKIILNFNCDPKDVHVFLLISEKLPALLEKNFALLWWFTLCQERMS